MSAWTSADYLRGEQYRDSSKLAVRASLHGHGRGDWFDLPLPTPAVRSMVDDSSGYSQSLLWNACGELVHATTLRNQHGSNDIVVTVLPVVA